MSDDRTVHALKIGFIRERWGAVVEEVELISVPLASLLRESKVTKLERQNQKDVLPLVEIGGIPKFHADQLRDHSEEIRQAMRLVYGREFVLRVVGDTDLDPTGPLSARKLNQLARHKREPDILSRWYKRIVLRAAEAKYLNKSYDRSSYVDDVIYWSQWADRKDLIEASIHPHRLAEMLSWAIRVIEQKEMEYADYLETPEWKDRAALCKERYADRCALSADHSADHAHHRTYERRGREHSSDLVPLCSKCHSLFHGKA